MALWLFTVAYAIASTCGLYLLKYTFNRMGVLKGILCYIRVASQPTFWLGMALYVSSFSVFLYILSKQNLNYTLPLLIGVGYIGSVLVSFFLLKESINCYTLVGIVLIGLGIVVLNIGR